MRRHCLLVRYGNQPSNRIIKEHGQRNYNVSVICAKLTKKYHKFY